MDRETTKVTTPVGKVQIELKSWLTGGERREITGVFLDDAEIGIKDSNTSINKLSGSVVRKAQDKTIEIVVVSFAGSTENILKNILDLREKDFDFVIAEIDKASAPLSEAKKK